MVFSQLSKDFFNKYNDELIFRLDKTLWYTFILILLMYIYENIVLYDSFNLIICEWFHVSCIVFIKVFSLMKDPNQIHLNQQFLYHSKQIDGLEHKRHFLCIKDLNLEWSIMQNG